MAVPRVSGLLLRSRKHPFRQLHNSLAISGEVTWNRKLYARTAVTHSGNSVELVERGRVHVGIGQGESRDSISVPDAVASRDKLVTPTNIVKHLSTSSGECSDVRVEQVHVTCVHLDGLLVIGKVEG